MKKVLPFEYPPITSYTNLANSLGILWPDKDRALPWFCDHFIQLAITQQEQNRIGAGDFYDDFTGGRNPFYAQVPFLRFYKSSRELIPDSAAITDCLENWIDHNYYIDLCLNRNYLSCGDVYQKRDLLHSVLIYGYDSDLKVVYGADFFKQGKYECARIPYEEITQAYQNFNRMENAPFWIEDLFLLKYVPCDYTFQTGLLKQSLEDYLSSCDSFQRLKYDDYRNKRNYQYGISYYDVMYKNIQEKRGDIRLFHVLCDHKAAMSVRIAYLAEQGYIRSSCVDALKEQSRVMEELSVQFRNMTIKYVLTNQENLVHKALELCMVLKQKDIGFTKAFLDAIISP